MPSQSGVLSCWMLLETTGLPRPWATEPEAERALSVWALVLADVTDERLIELTTAWLRSPDVRYGRWPMPGALLHALGSPEAVDDADEAWSEVLALLAWRGRDKCPATLDELESFRSRLRAAHASAREAGDQDRMARMQRAAAKLPRADSARTEALLAGVRACGGWRALGSADDDQLIAHRASFRATYRGHRQRRALSQSEQQIAALFEGHLRLIPGGRP